MRFARVLCLTTMLAGAVACGAAFTAPGAQDAGAHEYRATLAGNPALVQIVRLEHTVFSKGGQLHVVSVIRNEGTAAANVTARVCGLTIKGVETGSILLRMCAAYSQTTSLAPGDSLVQGDPLIMMSPAGTYTMRVQHLLDPALWVDIPIVVTP